MIFTEQQDPRPPPRCATSSSCGIFDFIKDIIRRHQINCMFQKLDSQFREIRDKLHDGKMEAAKDVEDLREELEKLHDGIMEAAKEVAEAEEGRNRENMKRKATNLITLYFRIEDVIEEWILCHQHEK